MIVNGYIIDAEADLNGAQLGGADLEDAYLQNAKLIGADLSNANLSFPTYGVRIWTMQT